MAFKVLSSFVKVFSKLPVTSCYFNHYSNSAFKLLALKFKMNHLYMSNENGDDNVYVRIAFNDEAYNIRKVLRFNRTLEQNLTNFLERIKVKVYLLYERKAKKKSKHSKKVEQHVKVPELDLCFLLNNEIIETNVTIKEIFEDINKADLKLRIGNIDCPVVINAPIIDEMALPLHIYVGTLIYPFGIKSVCLDLDKSIFTWHIKKGKEWTKCGEGFYFSPQEQHIGSLLKLHCLPVSSSCKEGMDYIVFGNTPIQQLNLCPELKSRHELTKNHANDDEIRVVTYNILANGYVNTSKGKTVLFTYCDKNFLDIEYRKILWQIELSRYNADLICLQEVDCRAFKDIFVPVFIHKGLDGVRLDKERRGVTCAFFYNLNKFKLLFVDEYYMHKEILENPDIKDVFSSILTNKKLVNTITETRTLLQVGVLQFLKNEKQIIVFGNAHLPFPPDFDHVRLLFGVVAIKILLRTVENIKKNHLGKSISVIFCGDFNSTPESGLHKFLNEGSIDSSHQDWRSKEEEFIENLSFSHPLKLQSAYGFPPFTNYTELFKGCLDYIYFQTDHLKVKQILPIPDESVLSCQTGIPNQYFPSDHVSLIADLQLKSE